jgi:hypothetical protein|tara:strand:+ start:324 stop:602 length:279 start_codon:yes stop_codon:yes gene_type:complete
MPLFKKRKEKSDDASSEPVKEDKAKVKEDKKQDRRGFRLDKIQALTSKATEVAKKRKWLAIILGLGIVIYFLVSGGGLSSMSPILENIKGLF